MTRGCDLCPCLGRAPLEPDSCDASDFLDLAHVIQEEERMKEEWQWLSIRCERRLNEQLRFYQRELDEQCDAVQQSASTPAPPEEFTSYVPKLIRRFVHGRMGATASEPRKIEDSHAVTVFCDVSGFTALAEAIELSGDPEAAATLGRSLNSFFDPLICIINRWGGDIMKFSGDAVLVAWFVRRGAGENANADRDLGEVSPDPNMAPLPCNEEVWRQCSLALRCCDELHKTLHEFPTGVGDKTLAMHIGVGYGHVSVVHVGGVMERREFVVAGKPLEEIAVAEPLAHQGQTVISRSVYEVMSEHVQVREIAGESDFFVFCDFIETPDVEPGAIVHERFEFPQDAVSAFRHYMPSYIFFRLMSGYSVFNNEMRRLSTVFVSVRGLDVASPGGSDTAHELMSICQRATYALEGSVNKFLVDDKGVVLLMFIGFPPVYHTDDPVRSVFVGLRIANDCEKLGMRVGIGISTGKVWCGTLGNNMRREYTCLGDYVNLAARLMTQAAASEDQRIMVDESTAREADAFLEFEELCAMRLKGKESWTKVFAPTGKVRRPDALSLESRSPLETWNRWDAYRSVKERLVESELLEHGGLMLVNGHSGCGTIDLQAAITRTVKKRGYANCFSVSTMQEESPAISIASDSNCAWRNLCNGLVTAWASSTARRAMVSTYHSKYLYVQSDHCVSKKVVLDIVKELLDPALHWRIGALKPLIMGLEIEPLMGLLGRRIAPDPHQPPGISGMLQRWLAVDNSAECASNSDSDGSATSGESARDAQETPVPCDATLLEQSIMHEPIAPFVTSMVEGFSLAESVCVVLNIRRGSSVYASMEDESWATVCELSRLAVSRRRARMAGSTTAKPILFVVVSSPQHVFLEWHGELVALARECGASIRLSKLNRPQLVNFVAHTLQLEPSAVVPEELVDHVYKNTCGMARFVYKTLQKLVEIGAVTLCDASDGSEPSSSASDVEAPPSGQKTVQHSEAVDLISAHRTRSDSLLCPQRMRELGLTMETPSPRRKRLERVSLAGMGFIDEIWSFAMSVVDRLKPDELYVAKVACMLGEPFSRADLLGGNPKEFSMAQFDSILRSLVANEVLEAAGNVPIAEAASPNVGLRLCSTAIASVLSQRVLEDERAWFSEHYAVTA